MVTALLAISVFGAYVRTHTRKPDLGKEVKPLAGEG
jgi:hypothetical protein